MPSTVSTWKSETAPGTFKSDTALHIAINLLYLIPGEMGGAETYAMSLIETLVALDNINRYSLLVNKSAARLPLPEGPRIRKIIVPISGRSRALRYFWEQTLLPLQTLRLGADILHSMHYVGPVITPCKTVITIPDTNSISVGKDMPLHKRVGLRNLSKWAARTADVVVTISHFSKSEISSKLGIDSDRVRVIHSGCGWLERDSPSAERTRQKYGLNRPYLSVFGGGYPHKNIPRLVKAFAQLPESLELAVLGKLAPGTRLSDYAPPSVLQRIKLLGYVATEDIDPLLRNSRLFAFPSLYEGFGLPILEAQRAGTPVACSRAAAIPEIAGDSAEFFDPEEVSSITAALRRVLDNEERRQTLISLGTKNVQRFSWKNTAREYLDAYRSLAASRICER